MTEIRLDSEIRSALKYSGEPTEEMNRELKTKIAEKFKKNRRLAGLRITTGALAAALGILVILPNINSGIAYAMQDMPVIGGLVRVVTFRTYEDKHGFISADVEVPEIKNLGSVGEELNKRIDEYVGGIIAAYEKDRDSFAPDEDAPDSMSAKFAMNTKYDVLADNDNYFTIKVWTTISMASTQEFNKCFTVDKKNEKIIGLGDLFEDGYDYRKAIYDEVAAQARKRMEDDEMQMYFIEGSDFDIPYAELIDRANFYLNDDGKIVMIFDKYEIAPGAMGVCEFTVGKAENGKLVP